MPNRFLNWFETLRRVRYRAPLPWVFAWLLLLQKLWASRFSTMRRIFRQQALSSMRMLTSPSRFPPINSNCSPASLRVRLRMYLVSERRMVFSVLFIVSWCLVTVYNTLTKRDYCKGHGNNSLQFPCNIHHQDKAIMDVFADLVL